LTKAPTVADTVSASAPWGDRELEPVLLDHGVRHCLVVDRQADDPRPTSEALAGAFKRSQLRVAVRAPRPAAEQDYAVVAGECSRQFDCPPVGQGESEGGERGASAVHRDVAECGVTGSRV
jgi:hypothetical protein